MDQRYKVMRHLGDKTGYYEVLQCISAGMERYHQMSLEMPMCFLPNFFLQTSLKGLLEIMQLIQLSLKA